MFLKLLVLFLPVGLFAHDLVPLPPPISKIEKQEQVKPEVEEMLHQRAPILNTVMMDLVCANRVCTI